MTLSQDHKIKGTLLLDFVRMIRAFKDKDWNHYLTPQDWEVINSIVLPSKWYPVDLYKRCSLAAFKLIAQGNFEVARVNGQMSAKRLFETTYKSVTNTPEPITALKRFVMTWGSFSNFSMIKFEQVADKHARIHRLDSPGDGEIPFCYQMQGMIETVVEMTGGKSCKVTFLEKAWEGASTTVFNITWA
jgi:hypothetical protein